MSRAAAVMACAGRAVRAHAYAAARHDRHHGKGKGDESAGGGREGASCVDPWSSEAECGARRNPAQPGAAARGRAGRRLRRRHAGGVSGCVRAWSRPWSRPRIAARHACAGASTARSRVPARVVRRRLARLPVRPRTHTCRRAYEQACRFPRDYPTKAGVAARYRAARALPRADPRRARAHHPRSPLGLPPVRPARGHAAVSRPVPAARAAPLWGRRPRDRRGRSTGSRTAGPAGAPRSPAWPRGLRGTRG